jgi:hypothetical protein
VCCRAAKGICCGAVVPFDHTIGSENPIDFEVERYHHFLLSDHGRSGQIHDPCGGMATRMTYLIYIHAENEYKHMRDLPASTGRATDSMLRRRSYTQQNIT